MFRYNARFRVLLLFGLFALVSACSASDSQSKVPATDQVLSFDLDEAGGLSARPLTAEESFVVQSTLNRLVSACMSRAGYEWSVSVSRNYSPPPNAYPTLEALKRSRYSTDFAALVRASEELEGDGGRDPLSMIPVAQRDSYLRALNGTEKVTLRTASGSIDVSTNGCFAEANRRIYGSVENAAWYAEVSEVGSPSQISAALQADPEYQSLVRDWQGCMSARGVIWMDVEGSDQRWDSGFEVTRMKTAIAGVAPSEDEQDKIAESDHACLSSSGLYEVRERLLPEVKKELWRDLGADEADRWLVGQLALANAKRV